jgi:Family of unknown function (DUF6804)
MLTRIMRWVSMPVLLVAVFSIPSASYQLMLDIFVGVTAALVATQAFRARKYIWAAGFAAIAVLFNPIVPFVFSRNTSLWLDTFCLITFMTSLFALGKQPKPSVPLVTNPTPRSEPL